MSSPHLLDEEPKLEAGSDERGATLVYLELRLAPLAPQLDVQSVREVDVALHLVQCDTSASEKKKRNRGGGGRDDTRSDINIGIGIGSDIGSGSDNSSGIGSGGGIRNNVVRESRSAMEPCSLQGFRLFVLARACFANGPPLLFGSHRCNHLRNNPLED